MFGFFTPCQPIYSSQGERQEQDRLLGFDAQSTWTAIEREENEEQEQDDEETAREGRGAGGVEEED